MIRYLPHKEINKTKWDACVDNSANGIIYAFSWYLDVVCEGWNALVEDDYQSVFPITTKNKLGIHYIYMPFFTQQLGLFSVNDITPEKLMAFIKAIPNKYKYVELNLNLYNIIYSDIISVKQNLNHTLKLNSSYEIIKSKYSDNLKRNLKKAVLSEAKIIANVNPLELISIFKNNKGKNISHLKEDDYSRLELLINTCINKGVTDVYGVTKDNVLCAGAVFIKTKKRIIFLFSATNSIAKDIFAMPLLIDSIIKDNSEKDCIFDFEGSNDKNLARFYKSFGSDEEYYPSICYNKLGFIMKTGLNFYKIAKKFV
jgi:hypothetical protein